MNKNQRKSLNECAQQLWRITDELSSIYSKVEDVKNDEENKLDNLPDSFYESKGEEMEEDIERLEEVLDLLDDNAYSDAADLLNEFWWVWGIWFPLLL